MKLSFSAGSGVRKKLFSRYQLLLTVSNLADVLADAVTYFRVKMSTEEGQCI